MTQPIHVLGFSGSLRQASLNSALLRAADELLPEGNTLEIFDLSAIPLYNDDLRTHGYPVEVQQFRERLRAADAVLIATPEYNYSIPGVLKNALDWASRPNADKVVPLKGKPVAIMGATPGMFGTVRAQMHLRQMLVYTDNPIVNQPQVLVTGAKDKFDADLHLTDDATRGFVRDLLHNLVKLAALYKRESAQV